jgi:hypothetical protein
LHWTQGDQIGRTFGQGAICALLLKSWAAILHRKTKKIANINLSEYDEQQLIFN